ncbi:MAG: class I SAM-dependent methyltransferase, partial [Pseudomonadota bacterium]
MSQTTALRPSSVWSNPVTAVPFMATVFFSAVLVFLVQPMFAKMALPILGGSSSVWNVSLVCFQGALLAGYIYAHFLCKLKDLRLQVALHGAALLLSAVVLPLGLSTAFGTPEPSSPALWLIATFAVSIAPPFTVISATAPLIQAWYARSNRPDAHDPYHLYAASNAGSIIGLVAYPLLLEPFSALHFQTMSWSIGYGVLTLGLISCGLMVALTATKTAPTEKESTKTANAFKAAYWPQRAKWLALA